MSNAIATTNGATLPAYQFDHEAVLKAVGLNTRDPNAQALLLTCQRYGLDPILKHIVLISSRPYVTRDGLLHVAHRSGQLDGIVVEEQGESQTHWTAKVAVYRKDMTRPFTYIGRYPKNGHLKQYGPEMSVKCGEVMALRRAFDVSLCAREELWDQEEDGAAAVVAPPDAHHAKHHDNATGHGSGAYAAPTDVDSYRAWLKGYVERVNAAWLDRHTGDGGEVTPGVAELLNPWQLSAHLLKHFRSLPDGDPRRINAPDEARTRQVDPMVAIAYARTPETVKAEAKAYAARIAAEAEAKLAPPEPEDVPDAEYADDGDPDTDIVIPGERVPGEDG
jgi:hypothetical protein